MIPMYKELALSMRNSILSMERLLLQITSSNLGNEIKYTIAISSLNTKPIHRGDVRVL
jgi:hypothetical protein